MKKEIILEHDLPEDVITITDFSPYKFFGVKDKNGFNREKYYIQYGKINKSKNGYRLIQFSPDVGFDLFNAKIIYSSNKVVTDNSLDLVRYLLECNYFVYQFDKMSELALWLESNEK